MTTISPPGVLADAALDAAKAAQDALEQAELARGLAFVAASRAGCSTRTLEAITGVPKSTAAKLIAATP